MIIGKFIPKIELSSFRQFEPVENFQYKTSRYNFPPFHYENLLEGTAIFRCRSIIFWYNVPDSQLKLFFKNEKPLR